MKKILNVILSTLLLTCGFVVNIMADTVLPGIYFIPNVEEFSKSVGEDKYKNLCEGIGIFPGGEFETVVVFYNGESFINVSDKVTLSGERVSSYLEFTVVEDYFGGTEKIKVLKFIGKEIGGPATLTYNDGNTEYYLTNINVSYPSFFVINEGRYEGAIGLPVGAKEVFDFQVSSDGSSYSLADKTKISVVDGTICSFDSATGEIEALAEGETDLLYPNLNDEEHPFNLHIAVFADEPGGSEEDKDFYKFEYDSNTYMLGLGNGSSDGGTLHIDSGARVNLLDNNPYCGGDILIAKLDGDGNISAPATQTIYGLFTDFDYEILDSENTGAGVTVTPSDVETFGINTKHYDINISKEKTPDKAEIKFTFHSSIDNQDHEFIFEADCVYMTNTEYILPSENTIITLNSMLNDESALLAELKEAELLGQDVTEFNEHDTVTIIIPSGIYEGDITINLADKSFEDLTIRGAGEDHSEPVSVTLKGGINSRGINQLFRINFECLTSSSVSYNDKKVGLLVNNTVAENASNFDLHEVHECSFTGFGYGIVSARTSLVSGIEDCTFDSCGVGIYENSSMNSWYSDSLRDKFINCGVGIQIDSLPANCIPYQFIFRDMEFYNNGTEGSFNDYVVNVEGNFFYTKNFYGVDAAAGKTEANVRSAAVNSSSESKVYTNPCVRYPSADAQLGIDHKVGLLTGIVFNGTGGNTINAQDIPNTDMNILNPGDGTALAVVSFGGGN